MNINEKEIDFSRDYYAELGVSKNASSMEIMNSYFNLYDEIKNDNNFDYNTRFKMQGKLLEAMKVLTNSETRKVYDAGFNFYNTEDYQDEYQDDEDDIVEVVNTDTAYDEDDTKVVNDAKKIVSNTNYSNLIAAIILGGAILIAGNNIVKTIKSEPEELNNNTNKEIVIEEDNISVVKNDVVEEETHVEKNQSKETTEEVKVEENKFNVNNYTEIENTTNKVFAELANISSTGRKLSVDLDKNTVEALITYTRHSNPDFNINNKFSNEYAYEQFFALAQDGVDISMFYENLDSYENINQLYKACANIKQETNSYEDELAAYSAMNKAVSTMHYEGNNQRNDYPEIIAIRAIVDAYVDLPSMELARGGALENGQEGEAYYTEKEYAAKNSSECKAIYDKVTINNPNGLLTQATYKAIEEDETITKKLK